MDLLSKNYRGELVVCKETRYGVVGGHSLIVVTDYMGTNVIYGGSNDPTFHAISWDYGSHEKGEEICRKICAGELSGYDVCNIVYKDNR